MPLQLTSFPLRILPAVRVSFHDGFADPRHGTPHDAVDVSAPQGTHVLAAADGVVLQSWMSGHGTVTGAGWSPRGGNIAAILDNNDYVHYYAHMLHAPAVRPGQILRGGALLGQVSNTGSIAHGGPIHLHYQVWWVGPGREAERSSGVFTRRFGRAVNPYPELARLARGLGARVSRNGHVAFGAETASP